MCKQTVAIADGVDPTWPIQCAMCGAGLYPEDVLERGRENELHPRPALLMKTLGAGRVATRSSDFSRRASAPPMRAPLMVTQPASQRPLPQVIPRRSPHKAYWIAAAALTLLALAGAVVVFR